jgi:hypothetical protein
MERCSQCHKLFEPRADQNKEYNFTRVFCCVLCEMKYRELHPISKAQLEKNKAFNRGFDAGYHYAMCLIEKSGWDKVNDLAEEEEYD